MFSPSIILISFSLLCLCLAFNLVFVTCSSSPSLRNTSSSNQCHQEEYYALLHLKESFSSITQDDPYYTRNNTRSWKRGSDCCEWDGITCHPLTHHVIALDLYNNGIVGTINSNSSLFQLGQLQRLNLSLNYFSRSTISHKFGQFHFLKHLDLSNSGFSGRVPLEISQLTRLTSLDLSWNDLEISNVKLVFSNLTKLKHLDLNFIKLESQIFQIITNLSSLSYLGLEDCNLQGEFPTSILNLPHIKSLYLGSNDPINFHFPSLYNWSSSLESLDLTYSTFSSNIPSFYSRFKHLKSLSLMHTHLHGTIPFWVWNISEEIDLRGNELTGSLPSTMNISKLSSLTSLYLASNMLVGDVPTWVFSLKSLENIDLSNNNFRGNVSLYQVFSNHPKLRYLSLSSSGLSVTIIDGLINSSITSTLASSLEDLNLSNNSIHGEFPKWLQQLVRESSMHLNVSYNYITGVLENLPWSNLKSIDISNNKLTGRLPIISSPYTKLFVASNNSFTGPIDSSICRLTSLLVLDLSNNNLSGDFPHCLGSLSSRLNVLNLRSNNIHGTLPTNFSNCDELEYLDLSSNKLQGRLPRSLARCEFLQAINLRNNSFMDEFPHWLHTLQGIQVLDLSSNKLYGHINNVSEHHPYPALQILNLSSNNFSGKIPTTYIKNFLAMTNNIDHHGSPQYMESMYPGFYYSIELTVKDVQLPYEKIIETLYFFDLSNNAFEGEIPEYVGQLVAILGLNLSHNRLTGHIPPSIGSLSSLDSLDLSSNILSGRIPHELVTLTFLEVFNVSNNKLEGPIPQGNNFNTFSSDSYKENLALCGDPLPECGGNSTPFVINNEDDSEDQGSTLKVWETIVMGFCTGIVVGLAWGYYMFSVGKPFWFIKLADRMELALLDFFGTSNMVRRRGRRARTRRN